MSAPITCKTRDYFDDSGITIGAVCDCCKPRSGCALARKLEFLGRVAMKTYDKHKPEFSEPYRTVASFNYLSDNPFIVERSEGITRIVSAEGPNKRTIVAYIPEAE